MSLNVNFMVGGEAGQGVESVGFVLAKAFARGGFHVFADQDYESRVRGGHNFFGVRISDNEVGAVSEAVDILLALNQETIELHRLELTQGGVVVFDGKQVKDLKRGEDLFDVLLERLAEEKAGGKPMANTVALGVAVAIAIAIHNIPEGIAVSVPISYATGNRRRAFLLSFSSGLAEPVGAIIGYAILLPFLTPTLLSTLLASVAGIMVYISLDELLPLAHRYGQEHLVIIGVGAGMPVMAASLFLLS